MSPSSQCNVSKFQFNQKHRETNRPNQIAKASISIKTQRNGRGFRAERNVDSITSKIISELKANARITYAQLADRCGISRQALTNRIRRLEDTGVIGGYTITTNNGKPVDHPRQKYRLLAFLRVKFTTESDCYELAKTFPTYKNIINAWALTGPCDTTVLLGGEDMEEIRNVRETIAKARGVAVVETEMVLSNLM